MAHRGVRFLEKSAWGSAPNPGNIWKKKKVWDCFSDWFESK
jgi:hypothetical protein